MLLLVGLNGCTERTQDNEMNKFVGEWKLIQSEEESIIGTIIIFYSNSTWQPENSSHLYYYEVIDGELCNTEPVREFTECFPYEFSKDNNRLKILSNGGIHVYEKIA